MSKKLTIEEMREIAKKRRGKCLSNKYIDAKYKLRWQCKEGHEWEASPGNIKYGKRWCPYCVGKYQTIEDMHRIAKERGGKCLSKEYKGTHIKLKWRCKEGHIWEAIPANVKNINHWCPYCAGKIRLTIKEMQKIAKSREGECLSTEYTNNHIKLKWRCKNGHEWYARARDIKTGTWCPYCVGKYQTIKDMQQIAKSRGGECLSREYIDAITKLRWRCKEGHEWDAKPADIKNAGTWCPICSLGISERNCRKVFEKLFNNRFPKMRQLEWLINLNTGFKMELDGYCEELNIAFEYQGIQHYEIVPYFHRTENGLLLQQQKDEMKRNLCKENGVVLIEIPYYIKENFENYIISECEKKGIII